MSSPCGALGPVTAVMAADCPSRAITGSGPNTKSSVPVPSSNSVLVGFLIMATSNNGMGRFLLGLWVENGADLGRHHLIAVAFGKAAQGRHHQLRQMQVVLKSLHVPNHMAKENPAIHAEYARRNEIGIKHRDAKNLP